MIPQPEWYIIYISKKCFDNTKGNSIYLLSYCKRKYNFNHIDTLMQLLYVGRLDEEKWIISLLFCIKKMIKNSIKFHIHIYGKGKYSNQIDILQKKYPSYISSYGRKNKKEIVWQRKKCDFFIMSSTFLETFWLTACESLLCWVPIIGNKKWWLIPFIDNDLDIQQYPWNHDGEKLYNLITYLIQSNKSKENYNKIITETKAKYSKSEWIKKIRKIIEPSTNILMISDFVNYNGWWIETHINDANNLLQQSWYTSQIYGHSSPYGKASTLIKLFIMTMSFLNIYDSIIIQKYIKRKKVWLIWRHSISRVIGWLPVWTTNKNMKQIITHHELWLFHPFPSRTLHEEQIPKPRSLSSFVKAGQTNNIFKKIAIVGKYIMIRLIHKQLQKKVKIHIVPSAWMIPMIKAWHPESEVIEIWHFVDIE